jgi:hypothetical protein
MAVRGATVLRWEQCPAGHPGKFAYDIFREVMGRAHSLEERAECEDERCRELAARIAKAPQWVRRKPEVEEEPE